MHNTLSQFIIEAINDSLFGHTNRNINSGNVNTSGLKFYHASPKRFRYGQVLFGGKSGGWIDKNHDDKSVLEDINCIYMTTNPMPHGTIARSGIDDWFIYEVEPLQDVKYNGGNLEYVTHSAKVVKNVGTARSFLQRYKKQYSGTNMLAVSEIPEKEKRKKEKLVKRRERNQEIRDSKLLEPDNDLF
jgi:hypothetical protein